MTIKNIKIALGAFTLLACCSSVYAKNDTYNILLSVENNLNGPIQVNWALPDGNTEILSCNSDRNGTLIVPAGKTTTLGCTSTTTDTKGKYILKTDFKYGDDTLATRFDIGGTYAKLRPKDQITLGTHNCYAVGEVSTTIQCSN